MGSELDVLKKIWGNDGEAYIKLISNQTRFGSDYVRYLCNCLIKRGQIKLVEKKPGWYRITAKGEKELKLLGIIKPKILKKNKEARKVILPWPKELLKVRLPKGKEIPVEEKKLRLGKMVEKTISFLKASTRSALLRPSALRRSSRGLSPEGLRLEEVDAEGIRLSSAEVPAEASTSSTKGRERRKGALLRQGYGGQGKRKKYAKR